MSIKPYKKQNKILQAIMVIIFWDLFWDIFHYKWNKMWWSVINIVYRSCLKSSWTASDWGSMEISANSQNFIVKHSAQSSSQNGIFFDTSRKLLKNRNWIFPIALFHIKTRLCLKYFIHNCSIRLFADDDSIFFGVRDVILQQIIWIMTH